jgi:O-antigen/teichoic acid export membrane protein
VNPATDAAPGQPADILDTAEAGPRVIRGSALRLGGYAASTLLSVLAAALLTRHLGAADFGRYSAIFALATIVTGLADAGTATLGVREHTLRGRDDGRRFLGQLLGLRLVLACAGVLLALAFVVAAGYDAEMVAGAAVAGAGVGLTVLGGTLAIPLSSALRLAWLTGIELVRQVATVAALVALVAAGAGIVPLLAVPLPVGVLVIAVTLPAVGRAAPLRPAVDRAEWARLGRLAAPFAAATIVGTLYAHVSLLTMSLVASDAQTGVFAAAFRVYMVLGAVGGLVVASAFPVLTRAARDDRERLGYALQRLLEGCLLAGAGLAVVTALGAPAAIEVVAGAGFAEAVGALRLLAVALLGTWIIALGGYALLSLERYRELLAANAVGLALSTGLTLALAPRLGADGAAIAVAAGDSVLGALYLLALRRGAGQRFAWAAAARVAGAAGVALAAGLMSGLPAVPAAALGALVYAAAAFALRAVPLELVDALLPWRSRSA